MGSWFAERLAKRGADLLLIDRERRRAADIAGKVGGRVVTSLDDIPPQSPILLALPIKATFEVLGQLAKIKSRRFRIVEISSFKKPLLRQIVYARRRGHVVASIHPLFGPGQRDDRGTVTIHVGRENRAEDIIVRRLLPRTTIHKMTWSEHDKVMLVALSLTHFIGISSAQLLSRTATMGVMTKSLEALLTLVSISLLEPTEFYTEYPMTNPEAIKLFKKYRDSVTELVEVLERTKAAENVSKVKRILSTRYDLDRIYKHFYSTPSPSVVAEKDER
jgi:prephenate dehydrogenase